MKAALLSEVVTHLKKSKDANNPGNLNKRHHDNVKYVPAGGKPSYRQNN